MSKCECARGCGKPTFNGKPGYCTKNHLHSPGPAVLCSKFGCSKPTWNGKPGYCNLTHLTENLPPELVPQVPDEQIKCLKYGCGKPTYNGKPYGFCCMEHKNECAPGRWMQLHRPDIDKKHGDLTALRKEPRDNSPKLPMIHDAVPAALQDEVVEVLEGPTNGFTKIRLAVPCDVDPMTGRVIQSGSEGWVREAYLRYCLEGTQNHGNLVGDGRFMPDRIELDPVRHKYRYNLIKNMIEKTRWCNRPSCCIVRTCSTLEVKKIWFIKNHFLGETGMKTGPKETLFHGCPDHVKDNLIATGFDLSYVKHGSFGHGHYFSPQACKAWSYAENHLLLCEVAPGKDDDQYRLTLSNPDSTLDKDRVLDQLGKRSAQAHIGAPYNHEERIVYKNTQCKIVYLVETNTSPGGGV